MMAMAVMTAMVVKAVRAVMVMMAVMVMAVMVMGRDHCGEEEGKNPAMVQVARDANDEAWVSTFDDGNDEEEGKGKGPGDMNN